jgi:hypothetical protein
LEGPVDKSRHGCWPCRPARLLVLIFETLAGGAAIATLAASGGYAAEIWYDTTGTIDLIGDLNPTKPFSPPLATATPIAPATAAELPRYDSAAYCAAINATYKAADTKKMLTKYCLDQENLQQAQLARLWLNFKLEAISRCDAIARQTVGGSYQTLSGCLVVDIVKKR